jgi:hypothetical protein
MGNNRWFPSTVDSRGASLVGFRADLLAVPGGKTEAEIEAPGGEIQRGSLYLWLFPPALETLENLIGRCHGQGRKTEAEIEGRRKVKKVLRDRTPSESNRFGRNRALHYDLHLSGLVLL